MFWIVAFIVMFSFSDGEGFENSMLVAVIFRFGFCWYAVMFCDAWEAVFPALSSE